MDSKVAQDKPSNEEYAVAKWIRNNVPSKKTKFDRAHNVEYFTGSRAIDALLENSPWSTVYETREQVAQFLDMMLRHKFFHRAKKVVISEEELNKMRGIKKKPKDTKEEKKATEKEDSKENKDAAVVKEKEEKSEEKIEERKEHKKKPKVSAIDLLVLLKFSLPSSFLLFLSKKRCLLSGKTRDAHGTILCGL